MIEKNKKTRESELEKTADMKIDNNNTDSLDPNEEKFRLLFGKFICSVILLFFIY